MSILAPAAASCCLVADCIPTACSRSYAVERARAQQSTTHLAWRHCSCAPVPPCLALSRLIVCIVYTHATTHLGGDDNALEILELAAATGHPGDREQTFPAPGQDALIRPLGEISLGASDTHKMFNRQLVDKPPVPVVLLNWVNWLTRQCKDTEGGSCTLVLAGHNIARWAERRKGVGRRGFTCNTRCCGWGLYATCALAVQLTCLCPPASACLPCSLCVLPPLQL